MKAQPGTSVPQPALLGQSGWGPPRAQELAKKRRRPRRRLEKTAATRDCLSRCSAPLTCGTASTTRLRPGSRHSSTRRRNVVIKLRAASRPPARREMRPYLFEQRAQSEGRLGLGRRSASCGACAVAASAPVTHELSRFLRSLCA